MRELNILGLNLREYTLREKLRLSDSFLKGGRLNTIEYVSARILMRAENDPQQKEWLEAMDIIVYCDTDIARAAGITARNYLREIENNSFLKELFKRVVRERRTVYLLSDTEENLSALESELSGFQGSVRIVGESLLQGDETGSGADEVINDINDKAPGVIAAMLAYPQQEAFVFYNRDRINADIWIGLQKDSPVFGSEDGKLRALTQKLQKKIFRRKVHQYENQEKTEL